VSESKKPFRVDEEKRRLLQDRLRLLGVSTFFLSFGFLALQTSIDATTGIDEAIAELQKPGRYLNGVAALVSGFLWLFVRTGKRPLGALIIADASATIAAAGLYGLMALLGEEGMVAVLLASLCALLVLLLRAVLVPSSWPRTAAISGTATVVILATSFAIPASASAGEAAAELTIALSMWLLVAVIVATVLSGVLFGLREAVRDARKLGQYTLTAKLGEGGMGAVYRAEHAFLRRPTAVKLLPEAEADDAAAERFEKEVQLTAGLLHPNTVRIFDYGRTPDGVFYYAMELLEGGDLDTIVESSGPQPPARVAHIMKQVAGSLAEAHGIGLIHRDIKPANILVSSKGVPDLVKVADFGLVTHVEDAGTSQEVVGTPLFMSPEAVSAPETIDGRADIYALGAVGYYLLTGRHVFEGTGTLQILAAHAGIEPTPPSEHVDGVPEELEALVLSCLAKEPADRPQDAEAVSRLASPLAAGWTSDDAAAWWEEHPSSLEARKSLPYALTLARRAG